MKVQHVPVDQLVFLKSRLQSRMTTGNTGGVLISSEHGNACCYELTGKEAPTGKPAGSHDASHDLVNLGTFRMTKYEEENVWAITTDYKNTILIAGDTAGYMYVFDITNWGGNSNKVCSTMCHHHHVSPSPCMLLQVEELSSWRAHVAEVVSVEYIPYDDTPLVLTASADCTARLWTVTGNYIGTFGQVREGRVTSTHITSNSYIGTTLEHQ